MANIAWFRWQANGKARGDYRRPLHPTQSGTFIKPQVIPKISAFNHRPGHPHSSNRAAKMQRLSNSGALSLYETPKLCAEEIRLAAFCACKSRIAAMQHYHLLHRSILRKLGSEIDVSSFSSQRT